ncbi:hypothetical protein [Sinimarinibacterium flocculans]|uniref:hypothetical protein n=1 Tax=Sinimarinibacterium flocculans TaxID=985250 RepID=UPI002490CEB8|nr:hypothetical protein [Sinimarinibacterium flocculans]
MRNPDPITVYSAVIRVGESAESVSYWIERSRSGNTYSVLRAFGDVGRDPSIAKDASQCCEIEHTFDAAFRALRYDIEAVTARYLSAGLASVA